jgi:hypothetical protein
MQLHEAFIYHSTSFRNLFVAIGNTGSQGSCQYSNGLWDAWLGFDSRQGQEAFLFSTASRPTPGPTHPPIQWELEALSWGKGGWAWSWSLTSISCSGQEWQSYTPTIPYVFIVWCLTENRDVTFFFIVSNAKLSYKMAIYMMDPELFWRFLYCYVSIHLQVHLIREHDIQNTWTILQLNSVLPRKSRMSDCSIFW